MNLWLQTRQFKCPSVRSDLFARSRYMHEVFTCQKRNAASLWHERLSAPAGAARLEPSVPALNNQCA